MTDQAVAPGARWASPAMQAHLRRRHRAERRFRHAGAVAIGLALLGLAMLLASIAATGWTAFRATEIRLDVVFDPSVFEGVANASPAERDALIAWLEQTGEQVCEESSYATHIPASGASCDPERAGIWGAVVG